MKTNVFDETILQPGDDIAATFSDAFGVVATSLIAVDLDLDPNFGWCCTILDESGNEMQAHDFESHAALVEWLARQDVDAGQ